jgi:hypothetical protein
MKRIAWLLAPVLFSAVSLYALDMGNEANLSGVLCNSNSVVHNEGRAACDQAYAGQSGEVVFVDQEGRVFKIANQDKVVLRAAKKIKTKTKPAKDKEDTNFVIDNQYMGG